jgi:hypothetical protein
MYNGKNLLDLDGSNQSKYVIKVVARLWTIQERIDGIIDTAKSKYKNLNDDRVDKLKQCIWAKFRVAEDQKTTSWLHFKEVANRHIRDVKRQSQAGTIQELAQQEAAEQNE